MDEHVGLVFILIRRFDELDHAIEEGQDFLARIVFDVHLEVLDVFKLLLEVFSRDHHSRDLVLAEIFSVHG